MNRYIITSPKFSGEIGVLYGLDNRLLFIDFLKCDLTEEQISYFKEKLPALAEPADAEGLFVLKYMGKSDLNIIKEGYRVGFEQWWARYNLKHNKVRALKLWEKLSEADQVNAFFKLGSYERYLTLNSWRTKAEPDTYLKGRFWESEWK